MRKAIVNCLREHPVLSLAIGAGLVWLIRAEWNAYQHAQQSIANGTATTSPEAATAAQDLAAQIPTFIP